ncbi:MAG: hypothetical protein KJO07_18480, partial [Deltaproteobacteria bacterium]|nr:hypothetical protein [Deltaproteobacteria bacterium]
HPDNSVIVSHFHYAGSGEHLGGGRMRDAAAELKLAVAADPDFEAAKKALAKLAASRLRRS